MTFEMILKVKTLHDRPWIIGLFSFFMAIFGQILSILFFNDTSGFVAIAFISIPLIQIFMNLMKDQEKHIVHDHSFVLKHSIIKPFFFMFIGVMFAFIVMYLLFSTNMFIDEDQNTTLAKKIFQGQIQNIYDIDGPLGFSIFSENDLLEKSISNTPSSNEVCSTLKSITNSNSNTAEIYSCYEVDYSKNNEVSILVLKNDVPYIVVSPKGEFFSYEYFLIKHIFLQNLKVVLFILFTSFLFGAGAIYILVWNASIVGVYIGNALTKSANYLTGNTFFSYTFDIWQITFNIFFHGIFEFTAFFISAIAGGILSIGLLKHGVKSKELRYCLFISLLLCSISLVLLFIGAMLEVFI